MFARGTTYEDKAFLQNCKTGMDRAINAFNIYCDYRIYATDTNYTELVDAAAVDNDLIIGIGYMWTEAIFEAAGKYPDKKFILVDAELSAPVNNAVSILFDVDEAAYPLGFLSAWWADSRNDGTPAVGYVGAVDIPQIMLFTEPFINGVNRYNEKYSASVTAYGNYVGTFFSKEAGERIADSIITLGADVIFGVGSETGQGALDKAMERGKAGIGVDVDQYYSDPEVSSILISSAMKRLDNAIYTIVESASKNSFPGGTIYKGNLRNSGVATAPYHNFESLIPDSIKAEVEQIKAGIISGEIYTSE